MKITNEVIERAFNPTDKVYTQMTKSLMDLVPGQRFTAQVTDIKPGIVSLKLADGAELEARSQIMPDAHIGDKATFIVKENLSGDTGQTGQTGQTRQILLEMVKPDLGGATASIVKEALSAANMQLTPENADIVNMLINANMPVDARTIQRAGFFKYTAPELSNKEILFLVAEDFPASEKSVEIFKGFTDKTLRLDENLKTLVAELEKLAQDVSRTVNNTVHSKQFEAMAEKISRIYVDLKQDGLENVPERFAEAERAVAELREVLKDKPEAGEAVKQLDNIKDNLQLMENIKVNKQFLQIPFFAGEAANQAELHVLKRNKGRGAASNENATAVLALDYGNLGHVEVVINKVSKSVTLQFKSDTQPSVKLLQDNSPKLIEALTERGFGVAQISFKQESERFGLADGAQQEQEAGVNLKRYSFDMRV